MANQRGQGLAPQEAGVEQTPNEGNVGGGFKSCDLRNGDPGN